MNSDSSSFSLLDLPPLPTPLLSASSTKKMDCQLSDKQRERKIKNRISANRSRQQQLQYTAQLKEDNEKLQKENQELKEELERVKSFQQDLSSRLNQLESLLTKRKVTDDETFHKIPSPKRQRVVEEEQKPLVEHLQEQLLFISNPTQTPFLSEASQSAALSKAFLWLMSSKSIPQRSLKEKKLFLKRWILWMISISGLMINQKNKKQIYLKVYQWLRHLTREQICYWMNCFVEYETRNNKVP